MKKFYPLFLVLCLANVPLAQTNAPAPASVPSTPAPVAEPAVVSKPLAISGWSVLGDVVADMLKLAIGGFLFGVAFGLLAHWVLKFMRRHRAGIDPSAPFSRRP